MEGNREHRVPGGQGEVSTADAPEKRSGGYIKEADTAQHTPSDPMCAEHASSETLRRYVKHVGISWKRTRYHGLTQALNRLLIS